MEHQDDFRRAMILARNRDYLGGFELMERVIAKGNYAYGTEILNLLRLLKDGHTEVSVKYENRVFTFKIGVENFGHDMFHASGKFVEIEELKYCERLLPKRSVIVDVGANIGNHCVFFAGMMNPKLVIPVEPGKESVKLLKANLKANDLTVDYRGMNIAVGSEKKSVFLNLAENQDLVVARTSNLPLSETSTQVSLIPLDDLITERVDFLKIDVEGFENEVIMGAHRILSEDKPLLMVEIEKGRDKAFFDTHIKHFGYAPLVAFPGSGYRNIFFRVQ